MKKGLLFFVMAGLVVNMLFAQNVTKAPYFPWIPSIRMFIGESTLNPAFDLQDYNSNSWRGLATTANINTNFLGLSTLTTYSGASGNIIAALVGYDSYNSATSGPNAYSMGNAYGIGTAVNKLKYSTYKIQKFRKVGLSVGESWYVNVASHVQELDTTGLIIPPSFGNPSAISVSDTTKVSAVWVGDTAVYITLLSGSTTVVTVTVTASPSTTAPFGTDVDREWIWVYTNLLPNSTFSTANDTTDYGFEPAPNLTELGTVGWTSTATDDAGLQASGILTFTFADGTSGIKATPFESNRVSYNQHQWYTTRIRLFSPDTGNTHQVSLFNFSNDIVLNGHVDVSGHILFGVPTTWTWLESPFYSNETGTGYPQFIFKASGESGSIDVDEIQIISAAPELIDLVRYENRLKYLYGQWTSQSDTTGWAAQGYPTATGSSDNPSNITISDGQILFDLSSASGADMKGFKWTADNGTPGVPYTPSANIGQDVGMEITISTTIGGFNSLNSIVLVAVYGVPSTSASGLGSTGTDIVASAEFGRINLGPHYAIGQAYSPYYQFQFGARTDLSGVNQIGISNVDFIRDNDTTDYGDYNLFP